MFLSFFGALKLLLNFYSQFVCFPGMCIIGSNLTLIIDSKQVTRVKRRLFDHAQSVLSLGFWLLF